MNLSVWPVAGGKWRDGILVEYDFGQPWIRYEEIAIRRRDRADLGIGLAVSIHPDALAALLDQPQQLGEPCFGFMGVHD